MVEYKPYKVINGNKELIQDIDTSEIYAGEWQVNKMEEDKEMITVGHHHDPMRGPRQISEYTIDSLYKNMNITGSDGYGKQSFIFNIHLQLIEAGYGVAMMKII